jgi:hypothetical protein
VDLCGGVVGSLKPLCGSVHILYVVCVCVWIEKCIRMRIYMCVYVCTSICVYMYVCESKSMI